MQTPVSLNSFARGKSVASPGGLPRKRGKGTGVFLAFLPLLCAASPVLPERETRGRERSGLPRPPEPVRCIRFLENNAQARLQTAILSFVLPGGGKSVDLVGAIHIADPAYYRRLNKLFDRYDTVLYELVASPKPPGQRWSFRKQRLSFYGMTQQRMAKLLNLENQLEHIRYNRRNFLHADMSYSQLKKAQKEAKESFLSLFLRILLNSSGKPAARPPPGKESLNPGFLQTLRLLFSDRRSLEMKLLLARQFEEAGRQIPKNTVIIEKRNQVALQKLGEVLRNPGKRKLAIFYGVAHMEDFQEKLWRRGFRRRKSPVWLTAWSMPLENLRRRRTGPGEEAPEEPRPGPGKVAGDGGVGEEP